MEKTLFTLFMLLTGSLALAAAQSQNQPQTDESSNPSSNQMSRDRVTVTGCLQRGTSPNTYVLNNATPSTSYNRSMNDENQNQARADVDQNQEQSDQGMNQNQSTNQQDQADQGQMPSAEARTENNYILIPDTSSHVDLKSHIGHKVEITGKMMGGESRNYTQQRSETATGQMSRSQSSTHMGNQPEIKVTSIRHIAEACQ
jgi:hypothetical protein